MELSIRIALVDDAGYFREALRHFLERDSIFKIVGEAANGHQAIELADSLRPDVMLIDYAMPYMNGLAATRIIKQRYPDTRIIMLTMFAEDLRKEAIEAGICCCLGKDADLRQLPQIVVGCHTSEAGHEN
jgi:DNA-binding NarL/FixJ family response regulator